MSKVNSPLRYLAVFYFLSSKIKWTETKNKVPLFASDTVYGPEIWKWNIENVFLASILGYNQTLVLFGDNTIDLKSYAD